MISPPGSGLDGLLADVQTAPNIFEVEMQVPTILYTTVYVQADTRDQAEAVAVHWAKHSRVEEWGILDDGPNMANCDGPHSKPIPYEFARYEDILPVTPENCLHERVRTDEIKPHEGEAYASVDGTCLVCGAEMEGYADIQGADDDGRPQFVVDERAWEVRQ